MSTIISNTFSAYAMACCKVVYDSLILKAYEDKLRVVIRNVDILPSVILLLLSDFLINEPPNHNIPNTVEYDIK